MINYTIALSLLISAVILLRAVFRKRVPQRLIYALWLVVIIKMCLPFSVISLDIPALPELYFGSAESVTAETTIVFETEIKDTQSVTSPTVTQPPITEKPTVTAPPATTSPAMTTSPTVTASPVVTAPVVTTSPAVTEEIQKPVITAPSVTKSPEVSRPAPAEPKINTFDLGKTVLIISLLGSVTVGAFFSLSAIRFSAKLREDRIFLKKVGRVSVYISQNALTPCVFGLIPKIYITPAAAESENLDLILRHELTHIRHGDNLWAVVRTAAVVVFWWNPLVWAAAMLSRRDAELACDEAVASHFDKAERSAYAHTILDCIPQKAGGAVGLSGAPIKERLIMLTQKRKTSVICIILALVLTLSAAGCSFIGSKPQIDDDTTVPQDTTKPNDTTETDEDTHDNIKEIYFEYIIPNPVEFTFGEGEIEVSAFEYSSTIAYKEINEEYMLIPTYKSEYRDGDIRFWDITVHILNRKTGTIVHTENLEDGAVPTNVVKTTENGAIVNSALYLDGEITSWEIKQEDGKFTITEVPYNEEYYIELGVPDVLTSPDGKTKVYNIGPKDYITVKDETGVEKIVLETHLTDEKTETSVKGYVAVDFIDNDRFVYRILGWEWSYGYGVYNVKTGEKVEYENEYKPLAAYNGKVYSVLNKNYEFGNKIAILDEDGVHTEISVPSKYTEIFERMKDDNNPKRYPVFHEGKWFVIDAVNQETYVFSDDLSEMVAKIKLPWDRKLRDASFSGGRMLLFFDKAIGTFVDVEDSPTEPDAVISHFGEVSGNPIEYVFGKETAGVQVSVFERSGYGSSIEIDEEHRLFYTFETTKDTETDITEYVNVTAYILNIKTGKIVQTEYLGDGDVPSGTVKIMENGIVVNSAADSDGKITTSWEIKREGDRFTITKVLYNPYYDMIEDVLDEFTSPDGKTKVYNFNGYVSVRGEDGVKRAVLQTHLTEPGNELTIVGYSAIGFLDSDRFAYRIGGWEWSYGYGIYNVKTGETVEYRNGFSPDAIYNGKVYSVLNEGYEFGGKIGILDENGVHREISVPERYAAIFGNMEMYADPIFHEGKWFVFNYKSYHTGYVPCSIYVFSDDLSSLLAEIKLTQDRRIETWYFADGRLNLIVSKEVTVTAQQQEDVYTIAEMLYLTSGEIREKYGDIPSGITVDWGEATSYDGSIPNNKYILPELLKFELEHSKYEETWGKDLNSIINPHMWERVLVTQDNFISAEITLGDFIVEYKTNLSNLGEIGELISVNSSTVEALRLFVEYCQSNKVTVSELTLRLTEEKRAQLTKEKVKNETIDSISFLLDMTAGEIIEKYGELKGVLRLSVTKKRAVLYTVESMPGVGLFYNTQRKTDDPDNDAYPIEVVVFGDYDKIFEGNVLGTSAKGKWDKIELADRYGEYRLINRVGDYVVSAYCDGPVGINIESDDPETVQKHLDSIHENPTGYVSAITVSKATDEPPKLSEELKLEIQKAYVENHNKNNPDKPITQEDTGLYGYCGEYSGAHVVTILRSGCQYPAIIESIIVNGEEISYSYPPPSVYKNGKFYGVESAFEKGILSAEDIKALAEFTKRR